VPVGTRLAVTIDTTRVEDKGMKSEIPFLATLILVGTTLSARMTVQGIEQALLVTAIEYGRDGIEALKRVLSNVWSFGS
jgi:hypothetical protein